MALCEYGSCNVQCETLQPVMLTSRILGFCLRFPRWFSRINFFLMLTAGSDYAVFSEVRLPYSTFIHEVQSTI